MGLPSLPPHFGLTGNELWRAMTVPIKVREQGWRAFAVQCAVRATPDGDFGPKTQTAVKDFQKQFQLVADGICGPHTQNTMLLAVARNVQRSHELPYGVLKGMIQAEGANMLAAVNPYTPPGGKPGVDCGPSQLRVTGPPFDLVKLKQGFDSRLAFEHSLDVLDARVKDFLRRRPSLGDTRALELAVLAHNWPAGADQIVRNGTLSSPNAPAEWTTRPEGGHYTRAEWVKVYPARILQFV